ncbi:Cdc15p [Rhizophagus irregularis DAOM 197198w]|uniref:Cdc15p n=1 Tax=Rhizophagus irregularis (strain DAOM 197198w) TaxID=1432141 RepID=A0A015IX79_RHIIW|nr:Cdc15p [Rhizophagus irregularis DAOM 197198w]
MDETPKNLWEDTDKSKYQLHVTIPTIDSTIESENVDERVVYIGDLEKRKQVYGICGECKEPGTGIKWCQSCNAKRSKDNFKNWTSGNKDIDEFIQQSQLNAVYCKKYLEWIPFEKIQNITYIAEGGFGKIYSAEWPEGHIYSWDIENQKWDRITKYSEYALKSLNNSSDMCSDFLNEIKSHLQIHLVDIIQCFGITQDPNSKEYMMVIEYCNNGNLRNYLNKSENYIDYKFKIDKLQQIARGLLDIHNAEKVHKDFHSGNILFKYGPYISDLGMCQPANIKQTVKEEGICGVLPYMAPEVLRGQQYTKAADIYSFGIIMNEFLSEEIPFNDIPHNEFLAIKICKGLRPTISNDIPKLLADLIIKCWDAEMKNRPTTKELYQTLNGWSSGQNSEIYFQIEECDKIRKEKFKNRSNEDKSKSFKTHPQAIYTSRLLNFNSLPKPVNSSFQFSSDTNYTAQSTSVNPISECLDVQLSELELNEICQDGEDNIE